jgi:hypothetical protein
MRAREKGVERTTFAWTRALTNRRVLQCILSHFMVFTIGLSVDLSTNIITSSVNVPPTATNLKYGDGWRSIEVFYGKTDLFEQQLPNQEWFAQCNQDIIVSRVFRNKTNGYFLDLAANDPTYISSTYSLEKKFKWTGLCIEPNALYWHGLAHRDCQVVAAVVGEKRLDVISFQFHSDGALGGIVRDDFDNKDKEGSVTRYTASLREILHRFNAPTSIDYFSFDVEGAEEFIMQHFPFDEYTVKFMSVERPKDGLKAILIANGYDFVGGIGSYGETLWAHHTSKHLLDLASIEDFITSK